MDSRRSLGKRACSPLHHPSPCVYVHRRRLFRFLVSITQMKERPVAGDSGNVNTQQRRARALGSCLLKYDRNNPEQSMFPLSYRYQCPSITNNQITKQTANPDKNKLLRSIYQLLHSVAFCLSFFLLSFFFVCLLTRCLSVVPLLLLFIGRKERKSREVIVYLCDLCPLFVSRSASAIVCVRCVSCLLRAVRQLSET